MHIGVLIIGQQLVTPGDVLARIRYHLSKEKLGVVRGRIGAYWLAVA